MASWKSFAGSFKLSPEGAKTAIAPRPSAVTSFSARGVEVRQGEEAVEAIHGEHEWLLALGGEQGDVLVVEDVLVSPEIDAAMSDIADDGCAVVEALNDGVLGGGGTQLAEIELVDGASRERCRSEPVGVGLEVSSDVGIVGDENDITEEVGAAVLVVEDLLHHDVGFLDGRSGKPSDGEVGKDVVTADGGISGVGATCTERP